jgi:hypothetical protein
MREGGKFLPVRLERRGTPYNSRLWVWSHEMAERTLRALNRPLRVTERDVQEWIGRHPARLAVVLERIEAARVKQAR